MDAGPRRGRGELGEDLDGGAVRSLTAEKLGKVYRALVPYKLVTNLKMDGYRVLINYNYYQCIGWIMYICIHQSKRN